MKKMILICLTLLLVGCHNMTTPNNKLTDEEIKLKYEEMENKLIEYGKLVYENEQWLNENSEVITTHMSLKDLFERNEYDISMFVNPRNGKKCDLDNSKIEFIISNVDDIDNIEYKFNPVLDCNEKNDESVNNDVIGDVENNLDDYLDNNKDDIIEIEDYTLYDILINYMADIYYNDEYMNGGLEPYVYELSLRELSKRGYDISMFINNKTNEQCDLDNSYGIFEIYGTTSDGKTDYVFGGNLDCE